MFKAEFLAGLDGMSGPVLLLLLLLYEAYLVSIKRSLTCLYCSESAAVSRHVAVLTIIATTAVPPPHCLRAEMIPGICHKWRQFIGIAVRPTDRPTDSNFGKQML